MILLQDIDILITIVYLSLCLVLGLSKGKTIRTLRQFAVGAGNAKAPLLTAVTFATVIGAGSTVGAVGKTYTLGLIFVIAQLMIPLFWLISAKIFAHSIERFKDCLTLSQVMYKLYGRPGRWVASVLSLLISAGVIAAQATAIGHIFNYFFKIDITLGILLSYGILTIYSTSGGIRSVVLTEVFQFTIFFFIIPLSCILFLTKLGNIEAIIPALPPYYLAIELSYTNIIMLISLIIYHLLPDFSGPSMQRYLMAANSGELRKSLRTLALISIPFTLSLCFIAYVIYVADHNIKPEDVLLSFTNQLPIGIKGLMITGLFAIIMSTAESWINSSAIIVVNDVIKPLTPSISENKQLILVRLFTILISVASVFIAVLGKGILELIWLLESIWQPYILIPICAGFLGFKTNSKTFIANIAIASIFCIFGRLMAGEFGIISLAVGLLGSAIGFFGCHYWQVYNKTLNQPLPRFVMRIPVWKNPFANFSHKIKMWRGNVWNEKPRYAVFAAFTLNYYFFFSLFLRNNPTHQILLILLFLGFLLSGPLLMRDVFFDKDFQKKYVPFYWYFLLTYCLPMVGSYCILASDGNDLWIINGLIFTSAVFYFLNAISSLVTITIGTILGYIIFASTHNYLGITLNTAPLLLPYVYLLILTIIILFIRHKEKDHHESIETMQALGGTIAHEVRSPMASMAMMMDSVNYVINDAIKNSENKDGDYHFKLSEENYQALASLNDTIKLMGSRGISTIDNILLSLKTSFANSQKERFSIKKLLEQTLEEYSAYNTEVKSIGLSITPDFKIECCPLHFKHMIFNLLKNAYKYNGNNVRIEIATKKTTLYFIDYGVGISKDALPRIFDRFYSKSSDGTGLGLALCKMVMESLGGNISCKSRVGKYTKFSLVFPRISKSQI